MPETNQLELVAEFNPSGVENRPTKHDYQWKHVMTLYTSKHSRKAVSDCSRSFEIGGLPVWPTLKITWPKTSHMISWPGVCQTQPSILNRSEPNLEKSFQISRQPPPLGATFAHIPFWFPSKFHQGPTHGLTPFYAHFFLFNKKVEKKSCHFFWQESLNVCMMCE